MEKSKICEYLKDLRRDMSLGQVEKITGLSKSDLSKIERGQRGNPNPKVLEKLAKAYGAEYVDLLYIAG